MPYIICANNHVTRWQGCRGSSRPDRCATCQAPAERAVWNDADRRWVRAGKQAGASGRRRVRCAVCGKSRMAYSGNAKQVLADQRLTKLSWLNSQPLFSHSLHESEQYADVKAGDWVCWYHEPLTDVHLDPVTEVPA